MRKHLCIRESFSTLNIRLKSVLATRYAMYAKRMPCIQGFRAWLLEAQLLGRVIPLAELGLSWDSNISLVGESWQ